MSIPPPSLARALRALLLVAFLPVQAICLDLGAETVVANDTSDWARHGTWVTETQNASDVGIAGAIRTIRQLPDGYLFVGTRDGAYVFDGQHWTRVPGAPSAFTLLQSRQGELLLGSAGNIYTLRKHPVRGYEADLRCRVREVEDPVAYLDEDHEGRLVGAYGPGLFFENGPAQARLLPLGSWIIGVASLEQGTVFALNENHYQLAMITRDGEMHRNLEETFARELGGHHIVEVKPDDRYRCWAISDDGRTFQFDGSTLTPAPWHLASPTLRLTPRCIIRSPDGGYLVGSMQDGLYVFDSNGGRVAHLNARNGLPEDTVVSATVDRDGSLWVATSRFVVRADSRMRFLDFGPHQGLKVENSEVVLRHRGRLFVAGEEGLFVQNERATRREDAFERVQGILTARAVVSDGHTLWVGDNRLTAFHGDAAAVTYDTPGIASILLPSDRQDRIVCGTTTGFVVLEKTDGTWHVRHTLPTEGRAVYSVGERTPGEYWGQLGTGRVARLTFHGDKPVLAIFGSEAGVPPRWIDLGIVENRLLIPSQEGTHFAQEWDPERGHFVESTFRDHSGGDAAPHIYHPVFHAPDGTALARRDLRIAQLVPRPSRIALAAIQQLSGRRDGRANGVYWDHDGSLWICHDGGVMRCSGDLTDHTSQEETLIVSVLADLRGGRPLAADLRAGRSLSLAPEENWLRVRAGLLDRRYGRFSRFRIWMEGFEPLPSQTANGDAKAGTSAGRAWSAVAEKDFTQLPSGDYRLHVEAVDGMGMRHQRLVVPILIRTPWYRTAAARVGYAAIGLAALFGFAFLRERGLKRRNHLLEEKVAARTEELRVKNENLAQAVKRVERLAEISRESEERFRRMANGAPVLIWMSDARGEWIFANETWRQATGLAPQEILGQGWQQCIHPTDLPLLLGRLETSHRLGTSLSIEHRLLGADRAERWVRVLARPLPGSDATVAGMIGIAVDVTEVRQAHDERLSMARALEQAQRVESLRVLAGGIAHDFNNLLTAIMAYASLLQLGSSDTGWQEGTRMTEEILKAANKAGSLCRQMLAYAGSGQREEQLLNLSSLVEETAGLLRSQLGRGVRLEIESAPRALPVRADEPQIQQLLTNLLTNSSEAIEHPPGAIRVRTFTTENVRSLPGRLLLAPGVDHSGPLSVIEISDTGPGFTPEHLGRIFEPFFTTKELGRGLGLSAVHGIVKAHRGYLLLRNEPGKGCTFWVAFAQATPATAPTSSHTSGEAWTGRGRVLVVDDEAAVRESMSRMLDDMGFDCVVADGGRAALALHAEKPEFTLAVVDFVMPICDGREVIDTLSQRDPGLPVLVVSGFTVTEIEADSRGSRSVAFLQKPFDLAAFRAAVRRLLECRVDTRPTEPHAGPPALNCIRKSH